MNNKRSNWEVRKVSFAEAEELDDEYYSGLSGVARLEILMELRSMLNPCVHKMEKVVFKRHIHQGTSLPEQTS